MHPEPEYQIKTRPPITEGHTWKQNIQLRIREQQLADEAMPIARYFLIYRDENAMTRLCSTYPVLKDKAYFGWFSTVKKNFTTQLSANNMNFMSKWTNVEEI